MDLCIFTLFATQPPILLKLFSDSRYSIFHAILEKLVIDPEPKVNRLDQVKTL